MFRASVSSEFGFESLGFLAEDVLSGAKRAECSFLDL
jgi:hypothetical protein